MIHLILLIFAFVLAVIEAFRGWGAGPWAVPHLGWLGIAFFFLTLILGGAIH